MSRMRARHETLTRDILSIHSDFFMAVYGYRKVHAQLLLQGWDPGEVGRNQVMNVMCEPGIRGVNRGRTPVTTRPAKGTGGRADLVDRKFEACAPNRLHVAGIVYVRMADGRFAYTAFVTDAYAQEDRRLVRAPRPWTRRNCPCRRWSRPSPGPRPTAERIVSSTTATMARSTSARCTSPGSGNMA